MKNLGLDLDGVLYDWHTPVWNYHRLYKGFEGSFDEFWSGDAQKSLPYDYLMGVDIFYSSAFPTKDVVSFLDYVKDRFNIYYITARPESVRLTTEQYFRRYNFPYVDNLIFSHDKVPVARKLGLDYMIEDSAPNVIKLSDVVFTILVARPWNRHIQNEYPTIRNLMESIKYLEV